MPSPSPGTFFILSFSGITYFLLQVLFLSLRIALPKSSAQGTSSAGRAIFLYPCILLLIIHYLHIA